MKFGSRRETSWLAVIGLVLFFAAAFVVALLMNSVGTVAWGNWQSFLNVALLFAVFGAYYGAIVALDIKSEMTSYNRPILRTALCGALGALAVLLVQTWTPQGLNITWAGAGAAIGGALGWLGWSWAKYIDF